MPPLRLVAVLPALTALLPLSGCCTLARLFCGPDKSPWVQAVYDTPEHTLQTFLEALRRDNPDKVFSCLAKSYRELHGIDPIVAAKAWERLHQEVPYLHLAGSLPIPEHPKRTADGGWSYDFDLSGKPLRVVLVRQTYWEVVYQLDDGTVAEDGAFLDHDSMVGRAEVEPAEPDIDGVPQSRVDLLPLLFTHPRLRSVSIDRILRVAVGREWKIADLAMPQ